MEIGCIRTVDPQKRVYIPYDYREKLGIKPGDKVLVILRDGEIAIKPVDKPKAER